MARPGRFPVGGVVGILGTGSPVESERLEASLGGGLGGVEVRADLLLEGEGGSAWSREAVLDRVRQLADADVPVLFTVRVPSHGGVFVGTEDDRVTLYRDALRAGAGLVDAEWGTDAARQLTHDGAPLLLSAHNFDRMLSPGELDELTASMSAAGTLGIKVVPTAAGLEDSARMLEWVAASQEDGPRRVGFPMGPGGVPGRILALARGAPLTYASLGSAVAPGQLSATELLEIYRAHRLTARSRVYGVVGGRALTSFSPYIHNPAFVARDLDAVYLPFQVTSFEELTTVLDRLRIDGISVTIPFKQDASRFADTLDDRSRASGATNTLVVRRDPGVVAGGVVRGFNTDPDGVLSPLATRLAQLQDVTVGIIGNGGAARGAVLALKEAGASPTLYYRNPQRGDPVAGELGVPGKALLELAIDRPRVIINATPLGTDPNDPSPAPPEAFRSQSGDSIALEMIYEPADTPFLRAARSAGATGIPGREMLVAQGVAQFVHFTGSRPSAEEFDANYRRGADIRASG